MKKLLLGSAAIALGLALAAPANAEGVKLDLAGHMKGYVAYTDQDTTAPNENRDIDIFRETEIHFTGETTLDNGLTVGFHAEADADGSDSFELDESYAYFSGSWGRVNFGEEDGAAYLLQVAAPSADSNIDGLRQYINTVNYSLTSIGALQLPQDYANDVARNAEKITYLTPVMSGFQAGISMTPDLQTGTLAGANNLGNNLITPTTNSLYSGNADDQNDSYGEVYEGALRYEGQFDEVGVTAGAGYTLANLETDNSNGYDDFEEWNVGLALDFMAFGLGAVYTENNNGRDTNDKNETWVVGLDYTTGPFKLGASYLNNDTDSAGVGTDVETDRYTGGVVYTYGPGMTFRGSVSYITHDITGASDVDATSVLLGTQINF